jgi:F420-dependent oxidoreductase-like protein
MQLPHFRPSTPETRRAWLIETAQAAEAAGVYSLWVMDHFFQLGGWLGPAEDEMMEGYSLLNFISGVTEKMKLGLMVGGVIYRQPAVTVKLVSTLDVLSGGRAYFGIGAAWNDEECKALGLNFPSMKTRFALLEEQLQIAKQMFAGDTTAYNGKHNQLEWPVNNPQPLQKPHPPILIGGMGLTKTLRLVAQYGDACNFSGRRTAEQLQEAIDTLKRHCETLGRDYDTIEKTVLETIDRSQPYDARARAKALQAMGFAHIIYNVNGLYDGETMKVIGEMVKYVADF